MRTGTRRVRRRRRDPAGATGARECRRRGRHSARAAGRLRRRSRRRRCRLPSGRRRHASRRRSPGPAETAPGVRHGAGDGLAVGAEEAVKRLTLALHAEHRIGLVGRRRGLRHLLDRQNLVLREGAGQVGIDLGGAPGAAGAVVEDGAVGRGGIVEMGGRFGAWALLGEADEVARAGGPRKWAM